MRGKLYSVGIGPGDPELMTLKSVRLLKECDVFAIPQGDNGILTAKAIVNNVVNLDEKEQVMIYMPMTKDKQRLEAAYLAGTKLLTDTLDQGKNVAFLTLGDPTVYSTYLYLHSRVAALGYETKIIPGVTSFCAAAAELGISLCENQQELHIIPGTYNPTEAFAYPGVKVMMKNDLPKTLKYLKEQGLSGCMVENCGLPNQRVYRTVEEIPEDAGYFSLLIVKGEIK